MPLRIISGDLEESWTTYSHIKEKLIVVTESNGFMNKETSSPNLSSWTLDKFR